MKKLNYITLFILLLTTIETIACDCITLTLQEIIPKTEVIVRGTFISVKKNAWPLLEGETEEDRLYYEGQIIVIEVLKGSAFKVGDTLSVKSDYSNCSNYYKNNQEYLFFASKKDKGIESDACSYTSEIIDLNKNDLYLRTKKFLKKK